MPILKQIDPASFIGVGLDKPTYIANVSDIEPSIRKPPCQCDDCQHGFYAYEEQYQPPFWYRRDLSDEEATKMAANYVQDTEEDRQYLLSRLSSHGDIIINRWKKRNRDKRHALLLDAVPELQEHRWLIPRYCYMPEHKLVAFGGRTWNHRCQLLLHWLSVDILKTNTAVLFALLHNRTVYTPQEWASFDGRQLILSWATGHFDVDFTKKCMILYGPRYGELVDWEAVPAHRGDIIGFPKGRLMLEAQAYLMKALRNIVDKILEGVDLYQPASSEKWKAITKLGFRHVDEAELWSPYTNQAFSVPPVFSVDRLVSIAQARMEALGDHLSFLQTDPYYMRRHLRLLYQGEFFKTIKKEAVGPLITVELFNEVMSYWRWSWIKSECEHLRGIHNKFRDSIRPGKALPGLYDRALGALELLLVNEVIHRGKRIGEILPQRPGFSGNWNVKWQPGKGSTAFRVDRKVNVPNEQKELFEKDPLEWCLIQLQALPDKQTNYDHAILFCFLESHLASSNAQEKARLDEILYQKVSDLAACHEMLVSVRLHRPQNKARDIDEVMLSENRIAWKAKNVAGYLTDEDMINSGTALLKDFYNAPWPSGPRNPTWTTRMESLQKALVDYWAGLRQTPEKFFRIAGFTETEISDSLTIISVAETSTRDLAVLDPPTRPETAATSASASLPGIFAIQTQWGIENTTKENAASQKVKSKTRPTEETKSQEEIASGIESLAVEPAKLKVRRRAYYMLSLMYPTNAIESNRELNWEEFVHAMSDLGFSARNEGGSAVAFEGPGPFMKEVVGNGKIIFHKPHPKPKIDPVMMHSMGRRMSKWFGWHRELFVPE